MSAALALPVAAGPIGAATCPHASLLASIPTWMELRIEAHRDARQALDRAVRELAVLGGAAAVLDLAEPPAWMLEIEQAHDLAQDRERDALALLLAEPVRSERDAEARAHYLAHMSRPAARAVANR